MFSQADPTAFAPILPKKKKNTGVWNLHGEGRKDGLGLREEGARLLLLLLLLFVDQGCHQLVFVGVVPGKNGEGGGGG